MSTTPPTYILPDTNLPLHFRRVDEIDWASLTPGRTPILLVPPILLRELEEHKTHHPVPKIRQRAQATLAWFVELLEGPRPIVLKSGVELRFLPHEPMLDFSEHRLSQRLADDELIASALEQHSELGDEVVIATADAPLRVKLHSRPVSALPLPDSLRLPPAKSAQERELDRLKRENDALRSKMPALRLHFSDGSDVLQTQIDAPREPIKSPDEVSQKFPIFDRVADAQTHLRKIVPDIRMYSINDLTRYNRTVESYLSIYKQYHQAWRQAYEFWGRAIRVKLLLSNDGRAPANNIDVKLQLPAGVRAMFPNQGARWPNAPTEPSFHFGYNMPSLEQLMPHLGWSSARPVGPGSGGTAFSGDGRTIDVDWTILKHSHSEELEPILLVGEKTANLSPIAIQTMITCNEADPVQQGLKIHILGATHKA